MVILRLDSREPDFWERVDAHVAASATEDQGTEQIVKEILGRVRKDGDAALLEYTNRFDRREITDAAELALPVSRLQVAFDAIDPEQREALTSAADRVRAFHERQKESSWSYQEEDGTLLGQQVTPVERVGLYVPGGKAAYPSSVLMNALPAVVAGVGETVMVVPAPDDAVNELVLAAAHLCGIRTVYTVGGAQAVAALAYGTETIRAVDKIVGPGNVYVATAKRLVFGTVGIDMVAGPSEILVICDGKTSPEWVAMDLFSQAEHDEEARAILVSTDASYIDKVEDEIRRLLGAMERAPVIRAALDGHGAFILVRDMDEAAEVANRFAPEHLELSVDDPTGLARQIKHAGAIFLGRHTPEAIGDYCAGPNHVLPTGRTARFSSPLGVYDFQKRSSLIGCSPAGADSLGRVASVLARGEGLTAHARSAELRLTRREKD